MSTRNTMSLTHWKALVFDETFVKRAVEGEWFRSERVNGYLQRAYLAGESSWMAADAVVQMWDGELRARREENDAPSACLRTAVRR